MSFASFSDRFSEHRTRLDQSFGVIGIVVVSGILVAVAGPVGLVVGGLIGVCWYALPVPYAIAVGHIGLVATIPDGLGIRWLVGLEAGFLLIMLGSDATTVDFGRFGLSLLGSFVIFGTWVAILYRWFDQLWLIAIFLVVIVAVIAYGIHRYEGVALGISEATP